MNKLFFIFLFFVCLFNQASASELFMLAPLNVSVSDKFNLDVKVNSDGILVNSFEMSIAYNQDLVDFVGYSEENSVIKLWIEQPKVIDGRIVFSGIVPGGVYGSYDPNVKNINPIPVVSLYFIAKKEGKTEFSFKASQILKNDGLGSKLNYTEKNIEILITKDINYNSSQILFDHEKPLEFNISYNKYSFFSETPSFVFFNAIDKETGIKEYKIKVGNDKWQNAKNPQEVGSTFFSKFITIRAIDYNDNYRDASIYIPGVIPTQSLLLLFVLIIFIIWIYKLSK